MTDQPCFECGSTERIGTACKPCNPEITDPSFGMTQPHYIDRDDQPVSNPYKFAAEIAWLQEAARYFSSRPTGGEDAAHWSNVYNAENANKIASHLDALSSRPAHMEAVAWREKVALTTTPSGGGRPVTILFSQVSSFNMTNCNDDERRVVMHGGETYRLRKSDADAILEAINAAQR